MKLMGVLNDFKTDLYQMNLYNKTNTSGKQLAIVGI